MPPVCLVLALAKTDARWCLLPAACHPSCVSLTSQRGYFPRECVVSLSNGNMFWTTLQCCIFHRNVRRKSLLECQKHLGRAFAQVHLFLCLFSAPSNHVGSSLSRQHHLFSTPGDRTLTFFLSSAIICFQSSIF